MAKTITAELSPEMTEVVQTAVGGMAKAANGSSHELAKGYIALTAALHTIFSAGIHDDRDPAKETPRAMLSMLADAINSWHFGGCPTLAGSGGETRKLKPEGGHPGLRVPVDRLEELVDSWRDTAAVERRHFGEAGAEKAKLLEGMADDVAKIMKGW